MRMVEALTLTVILSVAAASDDSQARGAETPSFVMNEETGRLQYQVVVEVQGRSKEELYALAQEWVATAFRHSPAVTQLADPERSKLIIRGTWDEQSGLHKATHTFDSIIETKNGRYRVTFTNVRTSTVVAGNEYEYPVEDNLSVPLPKKQKQREKHLAARVVFFEKFTERFTRLAESLRDVMFGSEDGDDW